MVHIYLMQVVIHRQALKIVSKLHLHLTTHYWHYTFILSSMGYTAWGIANSLLCILLINICSLSARCTVSYMFPDEVHVVRHTCVTDFPECFQRLGVTGIPEKSSARVE